mmetsp:Transcript_32679/g.97072  ORF Transcript_32679/g.97072 Transcript_32679/m.97072 type:complete len:262 (-) Transcript_32679:386-1171(-)
MASTSFSCLPARVSSKVSPARILQKSWMMFWQAPSLVPPMLMWIGLTRQRSSASSSIFSGHVAEYSRTCRSGRTLAMILRTAIQWFVSSMPSASSKTTKVARRRFVAFRSRRSVSLPGVATMASHLSSSSLSCLSWSSPPMIPLQTSPHPRHMELTSISTCLQSSRVGTRTRPTGPSPGRSWSWARMWMTIGKTYASVLPLPVSEIPTTSRPFSAAGQARTWMAVGFWKPLARSSSVIQSGNAATSKDGTGFGRCSRPFTT